MPSSTRIGRLLALADAEFQQSRTKPTNQKFKAQRVDFRRLDVDWERHRGAAARLMGMVLAHDSEALVEKVAADPATYRDAAAWLGKEASLLRKTSARMDTASTRLSAALARHQQRQEAPATSSQP